MPIVPTYKEQQVSSSPLPNNGFSVQSNPNQFGAGLGQVAEQYAGAFAEAKQRANVALAQDASLQLRRKANELMNDPRNGLLAMQGKNAIGKGYEFEQAFDNAAGEIAGTLQDDASKNMFVQQAKEMRLQFSSQANKHEMGQIQSFEYEQYEATKKINSESASALYADNNAYISAHRQVFNQIEEYGLVRGWSDEKIFAEKQEFKTATAKRAIENQIGSDYIQFMQQNGEPSDVGGVSRYSDDESVQPTGTGKARGLRNNNPGNIEFSKENNWVGQLGSDGRFVKFATPEHGIRALGKNLLSYARQGYVTPEQIITRWAPPGKIDKNDTEAYIKFVSEYIGVDRDVPLDLTDLNTLTKMTMAIITQENKGHKIDYTSEQISNGINSAIGLITLPNSTKRLTGSVAFDALNEAEQAGYIRQSSQIDKQRQQQLQTELGTIISDSYAAWERGLDAPNAPSEKAIISAFGYDKGSSMIADMREAKRYAGLISGAKDMTPQAQRSLLNSIMPDQSESNYTSKMQRWEKFGKFVDSNIKAQEKVFSANRLQLSIQNNFPLDPNDKSNQDAADNYFTNNIESSFNIRDESSLNAVAEISSRTGIIPSQVKSKLVTGSTSRNPELVIPMAKMYGQIFDNNPSAINGLSTDAMAYYGKIYDLTRSGMDSEKAIDIAYNLTYEQNDRTKAIIAEQMRDKKYSKEREKAAQGNINSFFAFSWSSPNITKRSVSNREYMRDYQTLYDANFASTGGDPDLAKKMTDAQVKKTWGVTSINGKDEVMRYAPEAVYGTNENGAGNWIIGQWREEQKQLRSKVFGGMPDDAEFVLVPDAVTARDYSYAIMLKQTGSDNIPVFTPFLGDNGMPSRFKPEQSSSPMYREVMDKRHKTYQEAKKEREILEGNAKPEPIDYGFSNTLNTMFGRE
ncbi:hypothetical protein QDQ39_00750 [Providencia rettgeri]|uniref:hypothetical protein n=1 Tax=Providencia rettgeri TaxID=587 RepID=UPI002449A39C|nr:hypothetical protein [Providencia rettgeri]MDH2394333.1 hypothetical protein [Providencia rettgeri]